MKSKKWQVQTVRVGGLKWQVRRSKIENTLYRILGDPEIWLDSKGFPLKRGQSSTVVRVKEFVIKRYNLKNRGRFVKDIFRISRAQRSFEIACRLEDLNLPVARPVGFASAKKFGLPTVSYYLSERIPGGWSLADLLSSDSLLSSELIRAIALLLAELHIRGISNRDLKAVNLVFNDAQQPYLVDLDGIRFSAGITNKNAAENLLRLYRSVDSIAKVSKNQLFTFVRAYCQRRTLKRLPRLE